MTVHRDTVIILLRNDADDLSLTVLEEMRLVISICSSVVHLIPRTELVRRTLPSVMPHTHARPKVSNYGFGMLHGAIMTLAAYCLNDEYLTESIKPQTDSELADAQVESLCMPHVRLCGRRLTHVWTEPSGRQRVQVPCVLEPQGTSPQKRTLNVYVQRE